jgi:CRP-like cAMP-binding protein
MPGAPSSQAATEPRADTLAERVALLGRAPLLRRLPEEALARLAGSARLRAMRRGETLFRRGDPGTGLLLVVRGRIRISVPSSEGRDGVLNLVRAGEVVGEIALLDGHPRTADAIADTDGEVMLLERRDLLHLIEENGALALGLMEVLCERLRQTSAQVEALMFQEAGPRIARALLQLASVQRLASVAVMQKQLGEMAGTSRESANRTLNAWEARGLVSLVPGRVTLRDEAAIRAIAEGGKQHG